MYGTSRATSSTKLWSLQRAVDGPQPSDNRNLLRNTGVRSLCVRQERTKAVIQAVYPFFSHEISLQRLSLSLSKAAVRPVLFPISNLHTVRPFISRQMKRGLIGLQLSLGRPSTKHLLNPNQGLTGTLLSISTFNNGIFYYNSLMETLVQRTFLPFLSIASRTL